MDSILEKSFDSSRGLLFGLLVNCIFSAGANKDCPLSELRSNLSTEEKYTYVMGLNNEEIKKHWSSTKNATAKDYLTWITDKFNMYNFTINNTAIPEPRKMYVRPDETIALKCPYCGKQREVFASFFHGKHQINVKCCNRFQVLIEFRKAVRKKRI